MKEKYNIVISERQAVPRSKRMREKGQSASSAAVLVSGAGEGNSSCDRHTHTNLPALERIGFDEGDDKYLMVRVGTVDDETGELIVTHEKVKAGYADKAHELDEDSPMNEKFLRKDQPDSTDFLLSANGGLVVRSGKILSELQSQISDSLSELDKDSITELGDEGSLSTALLELPVNEGITGTLGGLDNVSDRADDIDAQDVVLVKQKGGILWETIEMDKMKGKDGVIVYPTMGINVRTGHLILSVPTNNYENQFKVTNGHLILQQNG